MRKKAIVVALFFVLAIFPACERSVHRAFFQNVQMLDSDEMGIKTLSFSNKSASQNATFTANGDWYLTVPEDADWLTVSPASGFSSGEETTVRVNVADNPGFSSRTKYISIVCDGREQKAQIRVHQRMTCFLEVTSDKHIVSKAGGCFNFKIKTNGAWSYEVDPEGRAWLSETLKEGSNLILTAGPMTTEENHATIVFTSEDDPSLKETLTVSQKDLELHFQGKHLWANAQEQEIILDIATANISSWNIDMKPDWISAGNTDLEHLVLRFSANTTSQTRSGIIQISSPDDKALVSSINVTQLAVAVPVADLLDVKFDADGTATDISPSAIPIEMIPDASKLTIKMNKTYGVFAPSFGFTPGESSKTGFFRIIIPESIKAAAASDGFSMEAILKSDAPLNGDALKPFSAHFNGRGFGLGVSSSTSSNPNQFFFLTINASPVKTIYSFSDLLPQKDIYYDVLATFDKKSGKTKIYINGRLTGTGQESVTDVALRNPHIMTIGGSPHKTVSNKSIEKAWCGEILFPRLYSGALDEQQVHAIYIDNFANHYLIEQE